MKNYRFASRPSFLANKILGERDFYFIITTQENCFFNQTKFSQKNRYFFINLFCENFTQRLDSFSSIVLSCKHYLGILAKEVLVCCTLSLEFLFIIPLVTSSLKYFVTNCYQHATPVDFGITIKAIPVTYKVTELDVVAIGTKIATDFTIVDSLFSSLKYLVISLSLLIEI